MPSLSDYLWPAVSMGSQPQFLPRFNPDIPIPDFCFIGNQGARDIISGLKGTLSSGDAFYNDIQGLSYFPNSTSGLGMLFGTNQIIKSDACTILVIANPKANDGISCLFSQRAAASYIQIDLVANSDVSANISSPGDLSLSSYSAGVCGARIPGVVDGKYHVFAGTKISNNSIPLIYVDGIPKTPNQTSNLASGSCISSLQQASIGGLGAYPSIGYTCKCGISLVMIWNKTLSPNIIANIGNPQTAYSTLFSPPLDIPL